MEPRVKQKIQDAGYKICKKINQEIYHLFILPFLDICLLFHNVHPNTIIIAQFCFRWQIFLKKFA